MREYVLEVKKLIPQNVCDKIISYVDHSDVDALVSGSDKPIKDIRNCTTRSLLNPYTFGNKMITNYLKSAVFTVAENYKKKFERFDFKEISQLDILKYEANEFDAGYKFHVDFGHGLNKRALSISICLNNDYEGGEFVFDFFTDQNMQIPQNVGDAIAFPSNFMFPHQVNKITKGTRYAIIAWVY